MSLLQDGRRLFPMLWATKARHRPFLVLERWRFGIGDALALAACVDGLRAKHPRAWIVHFCAQANQELLSTLGSYDSVVGDTETALIAFIRRRTAPGMRYVAELPDEVDPPAPRLAGGLSSEFALRLGIRAPTKAVSITVPAEVRTRVGHMLQGAGLASLPYVVFHTGPSWPVKEWPESYWCVLTSRLRAMGFGVVQIGSSQTSERKARSGMSIPHVVDWTDKLTLLECAAVLARARAFVGIDSGPLHLAQAASTPVLGLFGPTTADRILQCSPRVHGIHANPDCIGCHHHPSGPKHHRTGCEHGIRCMHDLSPETVLARLMDLMATTEHPRS